MQFRKEKQQCNLLRLPNMHALNIFNCIPRETLQVFISKVTIFHVLAIFSPVIGSLLLSLPPSMQGRHFRRCYQGKSPREEKLVGMKKRLGGRRAI